jgi:hypothetical protein
LVTLVSFLIGYGIREIATKDAKLEASLRLETAVANALAKSQAAEERLKEADATTAKIKDLKLLSEALGRTDELKTEVAKQLKADTSSSTANLT